MQNSNSKFMNLWLKIPLILRAILLGFGVSTLGVSIWSIAIVVFPSIWSIVFMAFILILFMAFFSGRLVEGIAKDFRVFNFRSIKMSRRKVKWAILATILLVVIVQSSLAFIFRLIEYPEEMFEAEYTFISSLPTIYAWISITMAALVAGICEEIGYRGYLQTPIEDRYGAYVAIGITSFIFVLIHLHQAWAPSIIPLIFFVSVFLGQMAYSFKSIIPGIFAHVIFDVFNFSYWWSDLLGEFKLLPITETGIDLHFIITSFVFVSSIIAFFAVNKKVRDIE